MTRKLVFINSDMYEKTDKSITSSISSNSLTQTEPKVNHNVPNQAPKHRTKVVTSFNELENMKARSRLPIDITNFKNDSKQSNHGLNNNIKSSRDQLSDYEIINRLKVLSKTTNANEKTKVLVAANDEKENNRKYFSFMTTNKQFNNNLNNQNRRSIIEDPKLKIVNNQLVNELDTNSNDTKIKVNNRYSSSSSTSSSSDSGCGSSIIGRSLILNDSNEENHMKSTILSKSGDQLSDNEEAANNMKSLCEKIFNKSKTSVKNLNLTMRNQNQELNNTGNINTMKQKTKLVTILFDYETSCKSYNGALSSFALKKGERVKVLREYESELLVATLTNGRIGFVPKDYAVDLKEVEQRFKINQQAQLLNKMNDSNGRGYFNNESYMHARSDYENLKLTHL